MNRTLRNILFIVASIALYFVWENGGETVYARFVAGGVEKVTSRFSDIERTEVERFEQEGKTMIYCHYPDRMTRISVEYCLPVVLLLAWQFALFFDKRLNWKIALRFFSINFALYYFIQILFPLLMFNISQSKVKSMGLFIGLQIFGFIAFFLILKDSLIIKYKYPQTK
ncbi:MAG TPA: hypothetical protein PLK12_03645 [Prolixibacteraceae bacterium]|nr:hypothetical protein [Prolixibacteraceae bacterium]